jgi:hypothetical protein
MGGKVPLDQEIEKMAIEEKKRLEEEEEKAEQEAMKQEDVEGTLRHLSS